MTIVGTAAEHFLRGIVPAGEDGTADLVVLALERALVRDGARFHGSGTDGRFLRDVAADDPVEPNEVLLPHEPEVDAACRHVADWIRSARIAGAAWLRRTDSLGRPLKLTKLGSLARAVVEADKAMRRFASRAANTRLVVGDEAVHAELGDGWTLVRLLTPAALDRESSLVQHCIGQGSYDDNLADSFTTFLSLRDPAGRPHATIHLRKGTDGVDRVLELQGKQNARPIEKHVRRVRPWLRDNARTTREMWGAEDPEWWSGYVQCKGGVVADLQRPPARMQLANPIHLRIMEGDVLPTELLSSDSDLRLTIEPDRRSPVDLPSVLQASRIMLEGPGTFVVGRKVAATRFMASECRLEGRPDAFDVDVSTFLLDATVDMLPGCATTGALRLRRSKIRFEPGFHSPDANLASSFVDVLPKGFSAGDLTIADCPLREIPDGTEVGILRIRGDGLARIGTIPEIGALTLVDASPDLEMPDEMRIRVSMLVRGPGFPKRLPKRLRVDGELQLDKGTGMVLPEDLDVGSLEIHGPCIAALPPGTRIRGKLRLVDAGAVRIGEGCEIGLIEVVRSVLAPVEEWRMVATSIDPASGISRIEADGSFSTDTSLAEAPPAPGI